jgi:hypothetical protein
MGGTGGAGRGPDGVDGTGTGGGVYAITSNGSAHASVSSLFGRNTADTDPDFSGAFDTVDHTLVANGQGAGGISNGINGNIIGVADPLIGPLTDNGGSTLTVALLPGSPALNHGANPFGLATDQRGQARVSGGQADIGAFELGATPLRPSPGPMQVHGVMPLVVKLKGHRLLKVLDAQTGALRFAINPFGKGFPGNFVVATADVNSDGFADVLVTARLRPRHFVTRIFSGLNGARLA